MEHVSEGEKLIQNWRILRKGLLGRKGVDERILLLLYVGEVGCESVAESC
jgi:hypothetical protein